LELDGSVYAGFDPTAQSLHAGNLLALTTLVHFAARGHRVLALLGGATGRIGDPSWRLTAKSRLGESVIETNLASLRAQIEAFFPNALNLYATWNSTADCPEMGQVEILDNYDWYREMSVLDFLDMVGSRMRVAAMVSRESVRQRMEAEGGGLSLAELAYQALQAHDFARLHQSHQCRLQIGGSDQWGNIVSGLDLIHRQHEAVGTVAHGLTIPLLVTAAGEKMGKSAGNAKWLNPTMTAPFDLYQYFADLADEDCTRLLPMLSLRPLDQLREVIDRHRAEPEGRLLQNALAFDTTALVHSSEIAEQAKAASDILFGGRHHGDVSSDLLDRLARALKGTALIHQLAPEQVIGTRLVDLLSSSIYPDLSKSSPILHHSLSISP
jgi:tyrosyl-tRNA synthetase